MENDEPLDLGGTLRVDGCGILHQLRDVVYPVRVPTIQGDAGILPSAVCSRQSISQPFDLHAWQVLLGLGIIIFRARSCCFNSDVYQRYQSFSPVLCGIILQAGSHDAGCFFHRSTCVS